MRRSAENTNFCQQPFYPGRNSAGAATAPRFAIRLASGLNRCRILRSWGLPCRAGG